MTKEEIDRILDQLKGGTLSEYHVSKEDFLVFRGVLVNREDFKHFRGVAQRGGNVMYTYTKTPRS